MKIDLHVPDASLIIEEGVTINGPLSNSNSSMSTSHNEVNEESLPRSFRPHYSKEVSNSDQCDHLKPYNPNRYRSTALIPQNMMSNNSIGKETAVSTDEVTSLHSILSTLPVNQLKQIEQMVGNLITKKNTDNHVPTKPLDDQINSPVENLNQFVSDTISVGVNTTILCKNQSSVKSG